MLHRRVPAGAHRDRERQVRARRTRRSSVLTGSGEIPTLLDEQALADLHEDFASTDDLDELGTLIGNFVERGAEGVAAVAAAVEGGDGEGVRQAAHKLKGSSRTLGASLLGTVAAQAEEAAAAGDLEAARNHLRELEVVFSLTRGALGDMVDALGGKSEPVAANDETQAATAGLRALLADDEAIALAVLRAGVERLGHEAIVATDGEAAWSEYERGRPDVVITDMHMPGIGGIELARRIRAGGGSTYIAVLSASGDPKSPEIGHAIDASLSKPLREDELRAVLALAAQRLP